MESGKSSSSIKQFFTNRVQNIDVFNRLNHLPGQSNHIAVLVFYGISGIGKSYLLRNLYEASQARTNIQPHGYAQISFSRGQLVTESSQALWDLRGQLHASVKEALFERFDLFWGIMWERTHHLPIRENKELSQGDLKWSPTISDAVEFIGSFITIPLVVPLFKKVVDLGAQAFGDLRHRAIVTKISTWFEQHPKAPRGIPLKGFLKKASVDQLVEWLPRCFAADLADVSLECPLTLFIDGYEILQAQTSQQFGSGSATFIQILAEELARTKARVLLVIGGADHLRWTEIQRSDGTWVPRKDSVWKSSASQNPSVEQHQLANFSKADALAYLAQRRVPAEQAREIYQILGGYPLALSIAADLLEVGNQGSIEKLDFANLVAQVSGFEPLSLEWRSQVEEWLLNKLLEQLDANGQNGLKSLVRLAAIPRWFNEALLWELANTYTFQDDFQRLINYSFVKPVLEQPGWWRLDWHARRFLLDTIHIPSQRITWEERARTWFKNQSSQSTGKNWQVFELEALYHLWQIDPPQALLTVDELFQNPEMSQLEFRWDILATASEAESILPPIIRFDLLLHKAQLYLLTFSQLDRPGANKELALLAAEEATKLANDDHLGHSARGQAYLVTAEALNQLQRFPEATKSAAQACEAAQRNDDKVTLAQGLRLRTMLETSANPDFGNTDLLEQARDLLKESAFDHEGIAVVHDLGSALTRDLLWDQALLALRFRRWDELEAILEDIQQREQDPYWQAALEQYYGEGYTQQGKWQAALPHLERAYMLSRKLENTIGMCAAIGWWGIALYEGGKDDQGIPKLHEAFSLECDILASREGVAKWFLALGREVYQKRGTYELALDSLWRARSLYADLNHILVQQVDQCISQIRAAIGDEQFARLEDAFRPEHGEFAEYYLRSKSNIPLP